MATRGAPGATTLLTKPFLLAMGSTFGVFLAIGTLLPTLPLFAKGPLDVGSLGVGLAVAAASPTALLLQPPAGRLGDRRGRRLLVVAGGLVMATTIVAYTLADSLAVLAAFRLVTGAGEALAFVGTATVINDLAPDERRGEAVSLYSLAVYGGLALGPLLGEAVLGDDAYDRVWLVAAAAAFAAAAIGLATPETRPAEAAEAPSGRLLHRAAVGPGLVLVVSVIGFAGFNAFVALYARDLGLDGAGLVFALFAAVVVTIRSVGRRIPDRIGPRRAAAYALVLLALGFAVIGTWATPAGLYAGTVLFACGQALAFPALMTLAVSGVPAAERSSVVGSFSAFADVGFALGAVTLGAVASVAGYRGVFLTAAALSAAGLTLLARVHGGRPPAPATSGDRAPKGNGAADRGGAAAPPR